MTENERLRTGSLLMTIAGIAFIGYGVIFALWDLLGDGFELGVATIGGFTRAELAASQPEILHYISHLHIATAAFIIATGIAVVGLAWYGVRRGQVWALVTAGLAPVVALGMALPMHWLDLFGHDWVTHLGPVYVATAIFVVGWLRSLAGLQEVARTTTRRQVSPA